MGSGAANGQSAEIHDLVTRIYEGVFELPFAEFRQASLERARRLIPFDSAVWGSGVYSSNVILSATPIGVPVEVLQAYVERWQDQDFVRAAAVGTPGRAFRNEDVMDLEAYHRTPIYLDYSRPAGIEHALGVVQRHPITDLGEMVFLFRADRNTPFTEAEVTLVEAISRHLVTAWRQRQVAHHYEYALREGGVGPIWPDGYAVADGQGLLMAVGDAFCLALRRLLPDWTGPYLPAELMTPLRAGREGVRIDNDEFTFRRGAGVNLLAVARRASDDGLSVSERRVANLFARGMTHAEIAERLNVSPSTIRNQLASVYAKLGVHSKMELARRIARPGG